MTVALKAPLPYFGGKSGAAELIWSRFGNVPNYVEPFAGSLAVLLARPHQAKTETVNDVDGLLSNMWRAVRLDPDAVAYYADAPVVEVDLHAKHVALVAARQDITARLMADPDFYDAKLAGYYMWGACNWIGSGWCDGSGPWVVRDGMLVNRREEGEAAGISRRLPHLGDAGKGVSRIGVNRQLPHLGNSGAGNSSPAVGISRKLPNVSSHGTGLNSEKAQGVARQVPYLSSAGIGVTNPGINKKIPYLSSAGVGISNASTEPSVVRQLPHIGNAGRGDAAPSVTSPGVLDWMRDLSARLRRVRIACGDWTRITGESVTIKHGLTAVLLDPPYDAVDADNAVYGTAYDAGVSGAAWAWAVANGNNPLLRIAFCSYGNNPLPDGWTRVYWKARKGYQKVNHDGSHNGHRECIDFSPHCLTPYTGLFSPEHMHSSSDGECSE